MKLPATLDIIPGFRIIPESDTYLIKGDASGTILYMTEDSSMHRCKFHLVNTICKPSEMGIFNLVMLNVKTVDQINASLQGGVFARAFSIMWDKSTGLSV